MGKFQQITRYTAETAHYSDIVTSL